jgi:hypothetical protein
MSEARSLVMGPEAAQAVRPADTAARSEATRAEDEGRAR